MPIIVGPALAPAFRWSAAAAGDEGWARHGSWPGGIAPESHSFNPTLATRAQFDIFSGPDAVAQARGMNPTLGGFDEVTVLRVGRAPECLTGWERVPLPVDVPGDAA